MDLIYVYYRGTFRRFMLAPDASLANSPGIALDTSPTVSPNACASISYPLPRYAPPLRYTLAQVEFNKYLTNQKSSDWKAPNKCDSADCTESAAHLPAVTSARRPGRGRSRPGSSDRPPAGGPRRGAAPAGPGRPN